LEQEALLSEGHVAKISRDDGHRNARRASWETLEAIARAFYPEGCSIRLIPHKPGPVAAMAVNGGHRLKILRAYERQKLAQIAPSGDHARMEKLTPAQRQELGRRAAEVRWAQTATDTASVESWPVFSSSLSAYPSDRTQSAQDASTA
jgi:hypothetical protein